MARSEGVYTHPSWLRCTSWKVVGQITRATRYTLVLYLRGLSSAAQRHHLENNHKGLVLVHRRPEIPLVVPLRQTAAATHFRKVMSYDVTGRLANIVSAHSKPKHNALRS